VKIIQRNSAATSKITIAQNVWRSAKFLIICATHNVTVNRETIYQTGTSIYGSMPRFEKAHSLFSFMRMKA
jgi:hypothetical protein